MSDILKVPIGISENIVAPFFKNNYSDFIVGLLVLTFVDFYVLAWNQVPGSCKRSTGGCRKIFQNIWEVNFLINHYLVFFLFMSLVAVGVRKHGISPLAFMPITVIIVAARLLLLVFSDLFTVLPAPINISSDESPTESVGVVFRSYIRYLITLFTLDKENYDTFQSNKESYEYQINWWLAPAFGAVAGLLMR